MHRDPEVCDPVSVPRGRPSGAGRAWRTTTLAGSEVLIVEAENGFAAGLDVYLAQEGFDVRTACDGAHGLAEFESHPPQIVLIDLDVRGIGGLDLCRRIRATSGVPIIVMAARGTEMDTVLALEMGANDFVSRSCRLRELVARMRAALRRAAESDRHVLGDVLTVGPLTLDRVRCEVTLHGERLNLPRKEYRLLELLMVHPGRVFSRRTLIARVWGEDYIGTTKTLDVHVRRLRAKIEEDAAAPKRIVTVRGVGFKLEPPSPTRASPTRASSPHSCPTNEVLVLAPFVAVEGVAQSHSSSVTAAP